MSTRERNKDKPILWLFAPAGADTTRLKGYICEHSVR
jgi:hypothetical protein